VPPSALDLTECGLSRYVKVLLNSTDHKHHYNRNDRSIDCLLKLVMQNCVLIFLIMVQCVQGKDYSERSPFPSTDSFPHCYTLYTNDLNSRMSACGRRM